MSGSSFSLIYFFLRPRSVFLLQLASSVPPHRVSHPSSSVRFPSCSQAVLVAPAFAVGLIIQPRSNSSSSLLPLDLSSGMSVSICMLRVPICKSGAGSNNLTLILFTMFRYILQVSPRVPPLEFVPRVHE